MRLRTLARWLVSALMMLVVGAAALAQDTEPTADPGTADGDATEINTEDALGDLALVGRRFRGHLVLQDSGHSLHVALAQEAARRLG